MEPKLSVIVYQCGAEAQLPNLHTVTAQWKNSNITVIYLNTKLVGDYECIVFTLIYNYIGHT